MQTTPATKIRLLNLAEKLIERAAVRHCTPAELQELIQMVRLAMERKRRKVLSRAKPARRVQ